MRASTKTKICRLDCCDDLEMNSTLIAFITFELEEARLHLVLRNSSTTNTCFKKCKSNSFETSKQCRFLCRVLYRDLSFPLPITPTPKLDFTPMALIPSWIPLEHFCRRSRSLADHGADAQEWRPTP